MRIALLISLFSIALIVNAQKKHWINNEWQKTKKEQATSYYTLTKTDTKSFLVQRYYKFTDSLIENLNYPTKDLIRKEGAYIRFFKNGKPKEKGQYLNDLKTGVWYFFYQDGQIQQAETYKLGVKHGYQMDYSTNKLIAKYRYNNGKIKNLVLLKNEHDDLLFKEDTSEVSVYSFIDQEALFPGGYLELNNFIEKNSKNLKSTVYLTFNIDTTGKISEVELDKLTSIDTPDTEVKKAFKIIAKMPQWEPAMKRGRIVKSKQYAVIKTKK